LHFSHNFEIVLPFYNLSTLATHMAQPLPFPAPAFVIAPVIRLLTAGDAPAFYARLTELHAHLFEGDFTTRLAVMQERGYQGVGLFLGDELAAVSGFWILTRFYVGKTFVVDNLVVTASRRNQQLGQVMLDWLEVRARAEGCVSIVLDTYTHSTDAHRFYSRNRFDIIGFHFSKRLTPDPA
jgi:GNAT superfamily N-acetyltransferase